MPLADRFSVEVDRVVHETIDGETIIIQLETGAYYSLVGPGAEIWSMLATGSSTDEVVAALQLRFQGTPQEFAEATTELVHELRREALLEDNPAATQGEITTTGAVIDDSDGARAPFDWPTLQKYTDMQYFLMLDPIHEVDSIGWPNPQSKQTTP